MESVTYTFLLFYGNVLKVSFESSKNTQRTQFGSDIFFKTNLNLCRISTLNNKIIFFFINIVEKTQKRTVFRKPAGNARRGRNGFTQQVLLCIRLVFAICHAYCVSYLFNAIVFLYLVFTLPCYIFIICLPFTSTFQCQMYYFQSLITARKRILNKNKILLKTCFMDH